MQMSVSVGLPAGYGHVPEDPGSSVKQRHIFEQVKNIRNTLIDYTPLEISAWQNPFIQKNP